MSTTQGSNGIRQVGQHAVVIGGSMAGLLAARVLADAFDHVTVIDRDQFPDTPDHRKGVPQSHHAHALLERGQIIIERLFPGVIDDLRADGALSVQNAVSIVFVTPAGKLPSLPQPGEFIAFSRYRLEWHVRQRLAQLSNVTLVANCDVVAPIATADHARIRGVQLRHRDNDTETTLAADLVVDASGRNSHAPEWLQTLGYEAPPEETINSGIGYASRFYRKPADFPAPWHGIIINGRPPHKPRVGLILPVENDMWHVTVAGIADHYPPTDEAGFLEWAGTLADPSLYEAIRVAEPLTPIKGYRTPTNRFRHFERLQRWPQGFVVTGDAVAAFNPMYGQGITVSALDAEVLQRSLQQRAPGVGWEQQFQHQLAKQVAGPWLIATGEDLRWDGISLQGAPPQRGLKLLHGYMDLVLRQAVHDEQVTMAYMSVLSMTASPASLMQPRVAARVLGGALGRAMGRRAPTAPGALSPEAIASLQARPMHLNQ